jgi:hemerythrin
MLMLWNDSLKIGLPKIDEQHQELFRQVEMLMDRTKADRISTTISFLGDYVVKHFIAEQALQASVSYPKAESHKKLHDDFTSRFRLLKKKFEDSIENRRFEVVTEINRTAISWLKEHILIQDKDFADYYKNFHRPS